MKKKQKMIKKEMSLRRERSTNTSTIIIINIINKSSIGSAIVRLLVFKVGRETSLRSARLGEVLQQCTPSVPCQHPSRAQLLPLPPLLLLHLQLLLFVFLLLPLPPLVIIFWLHIYHHYRRLKHGHAFHTGQFILQHPLSLP